MKTASSTPIFTEANEGNEGLAAKELKEHKEMNTTTATELNRGLREPRERPNPRLHLEKNDAFVYLEYCAVRKVSLRLCALCVLMWLTMLFGGGAKGATRYVWEGSPNPGPPYTTWATTSDVIPTQHMPATRT